MTTRRTRTPQEQQAHEIVGKGWSVGHNSKPALNASRRYSAIIRIDGKKVNVGCRDTKEEAAILAVQAARHYGTLNWKKTVDWFKIMGYNLEGESTFGFSYTPKGKGWYVRKSITAAGTEMYTAYTGYITRKTGKYRQHLKQICTRKSKPRAIENAIIAAKKLDTYNESATVLWLERHGLSYMTLLAKQKRSMA